MIIVKTSATVNQRLISAMALLVILLIFNTARSESTNPAQHAENQRNTETIRVAQNETQDAANDESSTSSEKEADKSSSDEKKAPSGIKERPLKDFKPSEKIEAEQAVDFPYDI